MAGSTEGAAGKKNKPERLQKLMSEAGYASRRESEVYIIGGKVKVNGKVVTDLGSKATVGIDKIEVNGELLTFDDERIVIMLHKPEKVVVTLKDPQKRLTVMDCLQHGPFMNQGPSQLPRVYPVGRLDYDAKGLLLLTNDGELADRLTHPRYHVPKTYLAKVSGVVEPRHLERIKKGILLKDPDGKVKRTLPADVALHRKTDKHAWYSITVVEGRNHLIKRLFEAVGHPVRRLLRIELGGVKLGELPEGEWRALSESEIQRLSRWSDNADLTKAIKAAGWAEIALNKQKETQKAAAAERAKRRKGPRFADRNAESGEENTTRSLDRVSERTGDRPRTGRPRREGATPGRPQRARSAGARPTKKLPR